MNFPVDDLILEAEKSSTGKTEIDTGTAIYIEFYTGKENKHGERKTYWIYSLYQDGKRQKRVSPKSFSPENFGFEGATCIENCPYLGRVESYLSRVSSGERGDSGLRGGDETGTGPGGGR